MVHWFDRYQAAHLSRQKEIEEEKPGLQAPLGIMNHTAATQRR
jgi:hypothetical protein